MYSHAAECPFSGGQSYVQFCLCTFMQVIQTYTFKISHLLNLTQSQCPKNSLHKNAFFYLLLKLQTQTYLYIIIKCSTGTIYTQFHNNTCMLDGSLIIDYKLEHCVLQQLARNNKQKQMEAPINYCRFGLEVEASYAPIHCPLVHSWSIFAYLEDETGKNQEMKSETQASDELETAALIVKSTTSVQIN